MERKKTRHKFLGNIVFILLLVGAISPNAPILAADKSADPGYKVGEPLSPSGQKKPGNNAYKEIKWDALVPNDWEPFKALCVLRVT